MSIGGWSSLIASIAFVVLVVYLCSTLKKATKLIDQAQDFVSEGKTTIQTLDRELSDLSLELRELVGEVNNLAKNLNDKVDKTDPLFDAVGELGESLSQLNESANNLTKNISSFKVEKDNEKTKTKANRKNVITKKQPSKTAGTIRIK